MSGGLMTIGFAVNCFERVNSRGSRGDRAPENLRLSSLVVKDFMRSGTQHRLQTTISLHLYSLLKPGKCLSVPVCTIV